jgi:hypothetical protein
MRPCGRQVNCCGPTLPVCQHLGWMPEQADIGLSVVCALRWTPPLGQNRGKVESCCPIDCVAVRGV